ncbi:ABC transporter ATP-binding protein, partial [Veillonella dispar]|nr:ABC transporter ATP-binding protein [Veillonella dispar]
MRIIRYLKNCKVAVLLIVCLLVVQAFTDLALPHYTSDIVDVGIQQSGVEHAATDEMTAKTHDEIAMMLPVDDEQTFRDAYTETDDGTYKLNDQGKKEQEELDRMVALPLVAIHYSSQIPDLDLDQVMQAYEAGAIDKQKILDMLDEAKQHMGDMGDSIVDQQAIAAAKAEYESLGYNLSDMQMGYLVRIGLLMLGLAALGMV